MSVDWTRVEVGERVKHAIRLRAPITQNEFGRRAGIESGPMSRLVGYKKLDGTRKAPDLTRIADAWGFELDWLMRGNGPVEPLGRVELRDYSLPGIERLTVAERAPQRFGDNLEFAVEGRKRRGNPVDPVAIEAARRHRAKHEGPDLSLDAWEKILERYERGLDKLESEVAELDFDAPIASRMTELEKPKPRRRK